MAAFRTIGRTLAPLYKRSSGRTIATAPIFQTLRKSSTLSKDSATSKLSLLRPVTSSIVRNATQQQIRALATANDSKEYTVREALNEALSEELEADEKVFILGEEGMVLISM